MRLFGRKVTGENSNMSDIERFRNLVSFAEAVITESEKKYKGVSLDNSFVHPIIDVIRLLGRKVQTEYMMYTVATNKRLPDADPTVLMFSDFEKITDDGRRLLDIRTKVHGNYKVLLSHDLILPWPWDTSRMLTNITNIGQGRRWGSWQQDNSNHRVELWLPYGITWVIGGNHSITTGIIQGVGELKPEAVYDISEVYDHVLTDGENYIRKHDGTVISPVKNIEFAVIFEIGRMMRDRSISF